MTEVRGNRCRTTRDLFAEWAVALGFPDHFGHNWDAFEDCLLTVADSGDPVTVVVRDSGQLLADEDPRQLATFLAIIDTACQTGSFTLKADPEA